MNEKHDKYEIRKVANGYVVQPGYSINAPPQRMYDMEDTFVFPTWSGASDWLRGAFEVGEKNPPDSMREIVQRYEHIGRGAA